MPLSRRRFIATAAAAPLAAWADTKYPARTVRILSGFSPGGANDVLARLVAQPLSARLGQAVVVENRVGASGSIAAEVVANAAPDGHTLLMLAIAHCAHGALYPKLAYDVVRDFAPVTVIATQPLVMVIGAQVPAANLKEFVALAKRQPGKLFFASGGSGTSQHMGMEMFKEAAQVELTHVPYKGLPSAVQDMVNAQIAAMMVPISTALPQLQANKLRALGIASRARSKLLPQLPTLAEAGVAGVEADAWHGIVAPRATPANVIETLRRHLVEILATPALRAKLAAQGAEAVGNTPAQFAALVNSEVEKYGRIIRAAGIKPD
jgi:tripartite-type tricarboxylate transporter receptor subunit TctC